MENNNKTTKKAETKVLEKTPEAVLDYYFGYKKFRPQQLEIINQVLENKDTLVLMPTGGGKSLCFQVPALLMEGTCIVVSPLIALMQDQVDALKANGVRAAFVNSSQTEIQNQDIANQCFRGELKLLYVSPEKLVSASFMGLLSRINVSFFAIDEAHCISSWGHDFRPEYTQLGQLKTNFPEKAIIALTATADKTTRNDIIRQLSLNNSQTFLASFDRKNISIKVEPAVDRMKKIVNFVKFRPNESGIIYCLSRKSTEAIAAKLTQEGFKADFYHAGMPADARSEVQRRFIKDDLQIICATIAFGMGIDKPNVRFVLHYNLPKNMESYYQEIGRAGRDGIVSQAILYYTYSDMMQLNDFIIQSEGSEEFKLLQTAKLERMKQYAEAKTCRRKILLSYFGEILPEDCGDCDVCKNPPKNFDATVLAQKALSACVRAKEQVAVGLLVDILRGAKTAQIFQKKYNELKTYGAGADIGQIEWVLLIQQMIGQGVFEVAYDQNHVLKQGALSESILQGNKKLLLVQVERATYQKKAEPRFVPEKSKTTILKEDLFERLRTLRKRLADAEGVATHVVFNDVTLTEMAAELPTDRTTMLGISGVGQTKMELYGEYFLQEIRNFMKEKTANGDKVKGATYVITYDMFKDGCTFAEIAEKRNLGIATVQGHIVSLYEKGYEGVEIERFINAKELVTLSDFIKNNPNKTLTETFEALQGAFDYFQIRLTIAYLNKKK